MRKVKIKDIALCALFTAIIAATAWVSVPTPFGINLAFTIFGVSVAGLLLGVKGALVATSAYIALGAVGLPVFSQFLGGFGVLFGASGGFIWGFMVVAILCGCAKSAQKKTIKYLLMILSVIICHIAGVVQYSVVTGNGIIASIITASLPFLLKDFAIVFLAQYISVKILKRGLI